MKVFKFGGSVINGSAAFEQLDALLEDMQSEPLIIVTSALGKTTNELEYLLEAYVQGKETGSIWHEIKEKHLAICRVLFENGDPVYTDLNELFVEIDWILEGDLQDDHAYLYDQIVCIGELLSSTLVAGFLKKSGHPVIWQDARGLVVTNDQYTRAEVDMTKSRKRVSDALSFQTGWMITQGFIGGTVDNNSTTLGREGSDYSAALFATLAGASEVILWKDIDGVYTADPKIDESAERLEELSYDEALVIMESGCKVIHPLALELLRSTQIPLSIRPFSDPNNSGTIIG